MKSPMILVAVASIAISCISRSHLEAPNKSLQTPDTYGKVFVEASRWREVIKKAVLKHQPWDHTGLAVAIVATDGRFFEDYRGYADHQTKRPVDYATIFQVGSATKAFTSALFASEHYKKTLDLNVPVNSLKPGKKLLNLSEKIENDLENKITLVDMLSHQTSLARHDLLWGLSSFTAEQLLQKIRFLDFSPKDGSGFRKSFRYNNFMYLAAGSFLKELTGRSWQTLLENEIFTPLGMDSSHAILKGNASKQLATAYYEQTQIIPLDMAAIAPAGGIVSNVRDMSKWMRMLLSNGNDPNGNVVLQSEAVAELFKSRVEIPVETSGNPIMPLGDKWFYGLGWYLGESKGERVIAHAGNTTGYSTELLMFPDIGIGVIVTSNQSYSGFPLAVLRALQMEIQGIAPPAESPLNASNSAIVSCAETDSNASHPNNFASYGHPAYGQLRVSLPNRVQYGDYDWPVVPCPGVQGAYLIKAYARGVSLEIPMQQEGKGTLSALFDNDAPPTFTLE